jgi:hypothetical protein
MEEHDIINVLRRHNLAGYSTKKQCASDSDKNSSIEDKIIPESISTQLEA